MINEKPTLNLSEQSSRWLTEAQTAQRLNMSVKWLQADRRKCGRIRYAKFGSAVRYSLDDIEAFERKCLRASTSASGSVQ